MKASISKEKRTVFLVMAGLLGWMVPGGGYFLINEKKRAVIVFVTILVTFLVGLYVGSIGVVDPVKAKPWYMAQILNSPIVAIIGHFTSPGSYPVQGHANEIGQIYTSIAGLLNLLCIINTVYLGHLKMKFQAEIAND